MEKGVDYEKNATGWLIAVYIFAALGGFLGIIFGIMVYNDKVVLGDGTKVHKYKQSHRMLGLVGVVLSIISVFVWKFV